MEDINTIAQTAAKKRKCLNCPLNKIDISQCTYTIRKMCEWNYIRAYKNGYNYGKK